MQNKVLKFKYSDSEIYIRLITEADLEISLYNRNLNKHWFFYDKEISWEQHCSWYERYLKDDTDYTFVICKNDTHEVVGQLSLYSIDKDFSRAEFGRCLVYDGHGGKNFLFKATELLRELARKEFGLSEMYLEVKKDNLKAIHIYNKIGFIPQDNISDDGIVKMSMKI